MARWLEWVGGFAFRNRIAVLLAWVFLLVGMGGIAFSSSGPTEGELSMPGIESQAAYDLLEERFPGMTADGASATLVFTAADSEKVTDADNVAAIQSVADTLAQGAQVAGVESPTAGQSISDAGDVAFLTVSYAVESNDLTAASKAALEDAVEQARAAGLSADVSGSALDDQVSPFSKTEIVGLVVAGVVLLATFGAVVAAGLPLVTALVGVAASLLAIWALGGPLGLSSDTMTLAIMLGMAVGIDYALFILSRYRQERLAGRPAAAATARAVGTAGSAVTFAGLTVIIALAGLTVIGIPVLAEMGLAAAGSVAVAVLVALTLLPALIGFMPNVVLRRRDRRQHTSAASTANAAGARSFGARWIDAVLRRPVAALVVSVLVLGAIAAPALQLRLGMPGDEALPTSMTQRRAYDALAEGFGPGFNGPLTVVVDARGAADAGAAVAEVAGVFTASEGIVSVSDPTFNAIGDTAIFSAVPATSPTDDRTRDLVQTLRDERDPVERATQTTYEITGTTALNIDVANRITAALIPYIAIVVGLAFLLLLVVFRSILVPLKAALGFLLSVGAALGLLVLVFQHGLLANLLGVEQTGPIMSLIPVLLVGIVFGLAMDYEVFLVSRIREDYASGEPPLRAIVSGFRHNASVVVAAALIMFAVFGGFAGGGGIIKMIGFGLAAAVIFDAFVVRLIIVPAVLALLGHSAWWLPTWLDRILPNVDVEGQSLHQATTQPGPAHAGEAAHGHGTGTD